MTLLASQAAVAIENARLYESATTWSRQLESLNEIGNALVGELDLPTLLDLIARRLRELIGAKVVAIMLPAGSELRIAAADGEGAGQLVGVEVPRAESKAGRVFERGHSERVDSTLEDPEVDQESVQLMAATTGLYVPLLARDRAIGVIVAHDRLGADLRFSDADLRLAEQFAARAAVAVDLSLRVARDSLRRVVAGQELERRRLARELHDETGQALTSILLGLKAIEEAQNEAELRAAGAELRELIVATLQDVRDLAVQLRPKALDDFGLLAAVERLARTISEATGIAVDVESRLGPERLPEEVETTLYRIVQEALTNVVKHAQAQNVTVLLLRREGSVTAVIEDDGRGFNPDEPTDDGHGLLGIRERVALLDGRLTHRVVARRGHDARRGGEGRVTRVLLVDDHAVVRAGLRRVLEAEPDIEVVGEAGTARDAVLEARATKPDVILLDIVMPGESGVDVLPRLLKEAPGARVLVLSMQDDPRYVREAFAAGASGYVLKEAADSEVVGAVREVAAGGRYLHPALGARVISAEEEARAATEADPLSDREREVLRLLALGHTNQEIAKMLYISVRTTETHRAHIMQKLRLKTRAELVRYALAHGFLDEKS